MVKYRFWSCTPEDYDNTYVFSGYSKIKYAEYMDWSTWILQSTKKNNVAADFTANGHSKNLYLTW